LEIPWENPPNFWVFFFWGDEGSAGIVFRLGGKERMAGSYLLNKLARLFYSEIPIQLSSLVVVVIYLAGKKKPN